MSRPTKSARTTKLSRIAAAFALTVVGFALAGCDDTGGDPRKQIGANPVLPALATISDPADPDREAGAVGK